MVVLTMHSAWPFATRWKGAERTWRIPWAVTNSRNSPEVKAVPLLEIRVSGRPYVAKSFLKARIAAADEVELMGLTSSYLE